MLARAREAERPLAERDGTPHARRRSDRAAAGFNPFNARIVRLVGTALLTIRIDLDAEPRG